MTKPNRTETFKPLGEVLGRIAAKLAAQRNKDAAAPQDAAASCPTQGGAAGLIGHVGGVKDGLRARQRDKARMNGSGLAGVRDAREAVAAHVRIAMRASGGN